MWDYNPMYDFSLNICVRFDAVEEIFHKFSGALPKHHGLSYTAVPSLKFFTKGAAKFRVTTPDEITAAVKVLSSVLLHEVIPFFDAHNDLPALEKFVNSEHPEAETMNHPARAMHAVILAHLAGNKNFDKIVSEGRAVMKITETDPPTPYNQFNPLVAYLRATGHPTT